MLKNVYEGLNARPKVYSSKTSIFAKCTRLACFLSFASLFCRKHSSCKVYIISESCQLKTFSYGLLILPATCLFIQYHNIPLPWLCIVFASGKNDNDILARFQLFPGRPELPLRVCWCRPVNLAGRERTARPV